MVPSGTASPARAEQSLGWSIGVLFRRWQQDISHVLEGFPHGPRGFQILATVAYDEPPTQAALAAHLGIDRTVLTYVLDDLVAAGLLERQPHPTDRRVRRLAATTVGRTELADLEQRVALAEEHLLTGLTSDEQQTLRGSLQRAADQIHRAEPGHDACSVVADLLTDPAGPGPR